MIYAAIVLWLYAGMYSYIFWVSKHNKRYRLKWRTGDVKLIPLFGIMGPVMFIIGFSMFKQQIR